MAKVAQYAHTIELSLWMEEPHLKFISSTCKCFLLYEIYDSHSVVALRLSKSLHSASFPGQSNAA